MQQFKLEVTQGVYKSAKEARQAGRVPIVYYAKGVENVNVSADYQDFRRTYLRAGKSAVINLVNEEGKEVPVLVHEIQYDPVTDEMIHVDMMVVDMNKPITTDIPLTFIGQAPAVKELAGTFMSNKDTVHVECLPKDLPQEIEVDISSLVDFNAAITVGDVQAPEGVTILDEFEINVATVAAPREEEPEEEVVTEGEKGAEDEASAEGGSDSAEAPSDAEGGEEKQEG